MIIRMRKIQRGIRGDGNGEEEVGSAIEAEVLGVGRLVRFGFGRRVAGWWGSGVEDAE